MVEYWEGIFNWLHGFLAGESARPNVDGKSVAGSMEITETGYDRSADEDRKRARIVEWCMMQEGEPYKYGVEHDLNADEETKDEWDCSELFQHGYYAAALDLPDGSSNQFDFCRPVLVPRPADLNFLKRGSGRIYHVVMYIGGNRIIHAHGWKDKRVIVHPRSWIEQHPRKTGWMRHPSFIRPQQERRV